MASWWNAQRPLLALCILIVSLLIAIVWCGTLVLLGRVVFQFILRVPHELNPEGWDLGIMTWATFLSLAFITSILGPAALSSIMVPFVRIRGIRATRLVNGTALCVVFGNLMIIGMIGSHFLPDSTVLMQKSLMLAVLMSALALKVAQVERQDEQTTCNDLAEPEQFS